MKGKGAERIHFLLSWLKYLVMNDSQFTGVMDCFLYQIQLLLRFEERGRNAGWCLSREL